MKKRYRIKRNSEIDAIFKKKNVKGDSYFAIYQTDDPEGQNFRFAMSIGRKYGHAVDRNLMKRRIRMIISEFKDDFDKTKLFVIVIKPLASTLSYEEIKTKLTVIMKKSKLMERTND